MPYFGLGVAVVVLILLAMSLRILREYERGVVFQLGRFWAVKGPGLIVLIPVIQQMVRMDLRTVVLDVPPQDVITRDNVSVKVNAVVYFRIIDPQKAVIQVARLPRRHQPARPDHAARGARQARARRAARRAREAQPRHPEDPRLADRRLGHQGLHRRDQGRRPERDHGARHRPPGRGRARAPRQGDPRRRRAAGRREAARRPPTSSPAAPRRCSSATCRPSPTSPATSPRPSSSRCRSTS